MGIVIPFEKSFDINNILSVGFVPSLREIVYVETYHCASVSVRLCFSTRDRRQFLSLCINRLGGVLVGPTQIGWFFL